MLVKVNTVYKSLLANKSYSGFRIPIRSFYGFLLDVFNRPSKSRIKEVGPDRACAEWLLRNGAAVRWKGMEDFTRNYNCLPLTEETAQAGSYFIEDVDGTDAAISSQGFLHFENCNYVRKIVLVRNHHIHDSALRHLKFVAKTLNFLEIKSCSSITETGLRYLFELRNLKMLDLKDLQSVKNREEITAELKAALSGCTVHYLL